MKIVIDLRPLMSGKVSGVEVYIESMLKALFSFDQENEYILWYNSFKNVDISHFPIGYKNVSIKRTYVPNKILNFFLSFLRFPKLDRLVGKDVDIFWVPDPRPAPVSKGCKKIITVHDLSPLDYKAGFNWKTQLWHKLLRFETEFKEASTLVAVSQFTKSRIAHHFPDFSEKTAVIYEAVPDFKTAFKPLEDLQEKYKLPKNYLLSLSTLEPRKNIEGLLKGYIHYYDSAQNPLDLVIAGTECPSIFADLDLKAHPNIHFIGFVKPEDKFYLYHYAKVFLYLSFYEGFGLPILEAMEAGVPIITSRNSSMAEVSEDAAFHVEPKDPVSLSEALNKLLSDESLYSLMTVKINLQKEKFSWNLAAEQLLLAFKMAKRSFK